MHAVPQERLIIFDFEIVHVDQTDSVSFAVVN